MHVGKFWGPGQPHVPVRHQKDADIETERRGRGRLSGTGRSRGGGRSPHGNRPEWHPSPSLRKDSRPGRRWTARARSVSHGRKCLPAGGVLSAVGRPRARSRWRALNPPGRRGPGFLGTRSRHTGLSGLSRGSPGHNLHPVMLTQGHHSDLGLCRRAQHGPSPRTAARGTPAGPSPTHWSSPGPGKPQAVKRASRPARRWRPRTPRSSRAARHTPAAAHRWPSHVPAPEPSGSLGLREAAGS